MDYDTDSVIDFTNWTLDQVLPLIESEYSEVEYIEDLDYIPLPE